MILGHIVASFDEMTIPWVTLLLKSLAQSKCSADIVIDHFTKIGGMFHKKLQAGFEKKTAIQNLSLGSKVNRYEQVPDLYDYAQLWLCLQLVAVKKQKAKTGGETATAAIRLIA